MSLHVVANSMSLTQRVLLAGVGGQGVVSAASWLAEAADAMGFEVVVAQAHNMSRRGGSVSAGIVINGGPVAEIAQSTADILVGFEPMEAARAAGFLKPGGTVVVDTFPIIPTALAAQNREYPDPSLLLAHLKKKAGLFLSVPAAKIARTSGRERNANIVLLGVLQGLGILPWPENALRAAVYSSAAPGTRSRFGVGLDLGLELGASAVNGRPTSHHPHTLREDMR